MVVSIICFLLSFCSFSDVIERKLSNEGINSIGLKRAKRKQKTHNGDYFLRDNKFTIGMNSTSNKIYHLSKQIGLDALNLRVLRRSIV